MSAVGKGCSCNETDTNVIWSATAGFSSALPPHDAALLDLLLAREPPDLAALPPTLVVPAAALGDLPALLARTPAPLDEHGQYIDFDADMWRFRSSPLYPGAAHTVLAPDLRRPGPTVVERLQLRRRVRALSWHTHPHLGDAAPWPAACPSVGDLVTISLLPRGYRSRVHLVGAVSGTDAIVIARPPADGFLALSWSAHGRPPVQAHRRRSHWLHDLRRRWQEHLAPPPADPRFGLAYRGLLAYAASLFGLAYYQADASPRAGEPLVLRRIEPVDGL